MNKKQNPSLNITNFEEPIGNFVRIFPEIELTRAEIKHRIESTGVLKRVDPLEYFVNVGNGMNPSVQAQEIERIIPEGKLDPKQRAQIAIEYLDNGNHIGVSQEQYEQDLKSGKNHDETMRFFLKKILAGERFEPCVVVITKNAEIKFGSGINKVILDGTHRAVIASIVNTDLEVVEFSVD